MTYFKADGYLQTGKIPFVVLSYYWRRHIGGVLCIFHQNTANSNASTNKVSGRQLLSRVQVQTLSENIQVVHGGRPRCISTLH